MWTVQQCWNGVVCWIRLSPKHWGITHVGTGPISLPFPTSMKPCITFKFTCLKRCPLGLFSINSWNYSTVQRVATSPNCKSLHKYRPIGKLSKKLILQGFSCSLVIRVHISSILTSIRPDSRVDAHSGSCQSDSIAQSQKCRHSLNGKIQGDILRSKSI